MIALITIAVGATVVSTGTVVAFGARWRRASLARLLAIAVPGDLLTGVVAAHWFKLPVGAVAFADVVLIAAAVAINQLRRAWNPLGVWFFANLVIAEIAYLAYQARVTFTAGPGSTSPLSGLHLVLQLAGFFLATTFAFESCDVICRVRNERRLPEPDMTYLPFVSIHVPAYDEPPNMLIDTIHSLEALDYPNLEIVVVDNNTADPCVWKPVEEYCLGRPAVRFVHVAPWPGYKAGALNLALREYTNSQAEVIGIVDADFVVDAGWLAGLVGWFADPSVAFVQTRLSYREWDGDTYLTACNDAYAYHDAAPMLSRNGRNSPFISGTMSLIRRSAIEEIGGWNERCLAEDVEASFRILTAGHQGIYIHRAYGHGIMPHTFDALKRQRFRWGFGGIQILRKHWRRLVPLHRNPTDQLSVSQRLDFLIRGLQSSTGLANLGFTTLLLASLCATITGQPLAPRASGPAVVLPLTLAVSGLLRAVWALRTLDGISTRRAVLAFANWLSLSFTIANSTAQAIVRREAVFLRTPKWRSTGNVVDTLRAARAETALASGLVVGAVAAMTVDKNPTLAIAAIWQAVIYGAAPVMAWLNLRGLRTTQRLPPPSPEQPNAPTLAPTQMPGATTHDRDRAR